MRYKYFTLDEFDCQETGENKMKLGFIRKLDKLRGECGFPFTVLSGYRSENHSAEKVKELPGTHTRGIAADIFCNTSKKRYTLISKALKHGFGGVGVDREFIHLDDRPTYPMMWVYNRE